jgi:pectin methylesterase-like acyl-CoA thioesterase
MELFSARDGLYVAKRQSEHPAYAFNPIAKNAAHFGQLFLNSGFTVTHKSVLRHARLFMREPPLPVLPHA